MTKRSTPAQYLKTPLHLKLVPEDAYFVQEELRRELRAPYNAAAVAEVLAALRTWFHLPRYVVDALKKDAGKQGLLKYLQTLLHQRYEELARGDKHPQR